MESKSTQLNLISMATGAKNESQMLAVECLCNLSLGSESDCEKIAQRAGSYLHTFLQSSNEAFAVCAKIKINIRIE